MLASVVVFLVALPLCLGIALASGAPLVAGLVSGILGGLVVGFLSPSHLMVSGPAAGLTAILLAAIAGQGSFEAVLPAIVLAGGLQILLGVFRLGSLARFVPSAVIKGMLAAIGIILILKQLPHLVGWDADTMGDESFWQADAQNTFSELLVAATHIHLGATVVGLGSLALLIAWPKLPWARLRAIPAPLVVVVLGTLTSLLLASMGPSLEIQASHRVALPEGGAAALLGALPRPDWSVLMQSSTWSLALTLGVVASLETLLSLEATTKLDPEHHEADGNRELLAQGVGNLLSGLVGGLPMTGVIVRSTANIDARATSRWSAIFHGLWLILAALFAATLLNQIPLAALAAILLQVGYKLARPALFQQSFQIGRSYFAVFCITIAAILFTDLLVGIAIGLAAGIIFILRDSLRLPALRESQAAGELRLELVEQVTFLHRAGIADRLESLSPGSQVVIDGSACHRLDPDVLDVILEFSEGAAARGVQLRLDGILIPGAARAAAH